MAIKKARKVKVDKSKAKISSLEYDLRVATRNFEIATREKREIEAELNAERRHSQQVASLQSMNANNLQAEITRLMEIIRWQVKPTTADYPFMPEKAQRDERTVRGGGMGNCMSGGMI